jgi:hypothetical protein
VIKPIGGFLSLTRNFFYVVTRGALNSTNQADHQLIGVNVSTINSGSINGRTNFRAYVVPGMPTRHGFLPSGCYYSMPYYSHVGIGGYSSSSYYHLGGSTPGGHQGAGLQVASENGRVFFASHYQYTGPSTGASSSYGGPINSTYYFDWYYYYSFCGHVNVFDPNVGGQIYTLTSNWWYNSMQSTSYGYDYRAIEYIDPADDGKAVGIVADVSTASYYYMYRGSQYMENLAYVGNVNLNATTGALQSGYFCRELTMPAGQTWPSYNQWYRVAPTMAHHSLGGKVLAAWATAYPTSTSNENLKKIYLYAPTATDPKQTDLGLSTGRYNILNAAR